VANANGKVIVSPASGAVEYFAPSARGIALAPAAQRRRQFAMSPVVLLKSSDAIKWPRYEIRLEPGLNYKQATRATFAALRTAERQRIMLSKWSYDPGTGIVDTRVSREEF
jgi:hypothetical protein